MNKKYRVGDLVVVTPTNLFGIKFIGVVTYVNENSPYLSVDNFSYSYCEVKHVY